MAGNWQGIAFNQVPNSTNQIHGDEMPQRFGFKGGLVPGVTVSAPVTPAVVVVDRSVPGLVSLSMPAPSSTMFQTESTTDTTEANGTTVPAATVRSVPVIVTEVP